MARATMNPVISGLSGSVGKDHYARRTRNGKTIISLKPDFSNRQFSEAQLHWQSRMKAAAAYAKVAAKSNPIYAKLAEGKAKNAYNIALGDWLNPPVIQYIDWEEGRVRARASDDVMVTNVTVAILDEAGQCLEQGNAELHLGVWWDYQAVNSGTIRVEAWDLAGNSTQQEFHPTRFNSVWERTGINK